MGATKYPLNLVLSGVPPPPHTKPWETSKVLGSEDFWPPAPWYIPRIELASYLLCISTCRRDLWVLWAENCFLLCLAWPLHHRLEHPCSCWRLLLGEQTHHHLGRWSSSRKESFEKYFPSFSSTGAPSFLKTAALFSFPSSMWSGPHSTWRYPSSNLRDCQRDSRSISGLEASICRTVSPMGLPRIEVTNTPFLTCRCSFERTSQSWKLFRPLWGF